MHSDQFKSINESICTKALNLLACKLDEGVKTLHSIKEDTGRIGEIADSNKEVLKTLKGEVLKTLKEISDKL